MSERRFRPSSQNPKQAERRELDERAVERIDFEEGVERIGKTITDAIEAGVDFPIVVIAGTQDAGKSHMQQEIMSRLHRESGVVVISPQTDMASWIDDVSRLREQIDYAQAAVLHIPGTVFADTKDYEFHQRAQKSGMSAPILYVYIVNPTHIPVPSEEQLAAYDLLVLNSASTKKWR